MSLLQFYGCYGNGDLLAVGVGVFNGYGQASINGLLMGVKALIKIPESPINQNPQIANPPTTHVHDDQIPLLQVPSCI